MAILAMMTKFVDSVVEVTSATKMRTAVAMNI